MRKVLFKKWIPVQYTDNGQGSKLIVQGTACMEKEFSTEGVFHQWANAYEELQTGVGNYTVALVEIADGTIEQVLPNNIKFLSEN